MGTNFALVAMAPEKVAVSSKKPWDLAQQSLLLSTSRIQVSAHSSLLSRILGKPSTPTASSVGLKHMARAGLIYARYERIFGPSDDNDREF